MKTCTSSLLVALSFLFINCEEEQPVVITCDNTVLATVKDLTGLDGCGFVFELADGSRLEPQMLGYCGTPPLPKEVTENPLYNFQWVDGKQVRIGYEEIPDAASICMVGKIVKITCQEEVLTPAE
ncbi:MAG: hypothetical protein ABL895_04060 [Cyclobacteriaceae bacterium]